MPVFRLTFSIAAAAIVLAACASSNSTSSAPASSTDRGTVAPTSSAASSMTATAKSGLRLMKACPVTTDQMAKLVGRAVSSNVTAASVAEELSEAPSVYLQDVYLGNGLSAALIASANGSRPATRNRCGWQVDEKGLKISIVELSEPQAGTLADADDLEGSSGAGVPSSAPGLPADVHELTNPSLRYYTIYTVIGSGDSAISLTVDLNDQSGAVAPLTLQAPGRAIMQAAIAAATIR